MNIEQEIAEIKERNVRVEMDKKWETSWVRIGFIAILTYVVAEIWLLTISEPKSWLKSLVPPIGFILSTLSLPASKNWYLKKK